LLAVPKTERESLPGEVQLGKALALGSSLEYAKRLPALKDIAQKQSTGSFK